MLKNKTIFIEELKNKVPNIKILTDEPMSKHTTFRIGGPADYLILPSSVIEVAATLQVAKMYDIEVNVLGNGSNVLVLDKGIRGIVLKIGNNMNYIRHDNNIITAGAGAMLTVVSRYAAERSMTGLEFAVGIPGSIGGAVYMNAGAYEGEMSNVVRSVQAVNSEGRLIRLFHDEIEYSYRHSIFQENSTVICEVELKLEYGDKNVITSKINDYTSRRITKQPIEMPSAGSTFKRPKGYYAGTLIEQAGLKGHRVGGAQVSEKHAGFIVNIGGATANDVLTLISDIKKNVYDKFGVRLQPEIRILGE